jgi:hypothetical protein
MLAGRKVTLAASGVSRPRLTQKLEFVKVQRPFLCLTLHLAGDQEAKSPPTMDSLPTSGLSRTQFCAAGVERSGQHHTAN